MRFALVLLNHLEGKPRVWNGGVLAWICKLIEEVFEVDWKLQLCPIWILARVVLVREEFVELHQHHVPERVPSRALPNRSRGRCFDGRPLRAAFESQLEK